MMKNEWDWARLDKVEGPISAWGEKEVLGPRVGVYRTGCGHKQRPALRSAPRCQRARRPGCSCKLRPHRIGSRGEPGGRITRRLGERWAPALKSSQAETPRERNVCGTRPPVTNRAGRDGS